MAKIITEIDLAELTYELAKKKTLFAPVKEVGKSVFSKVTANSTLLFSSRGTILPPKEYLLPPSEVLFRYENGKVASDILEKIILFGLSIEDLEGVSRLTKIFAEPVADRPYLSRRENTIIIGVDRFSPPKHIPFDVYLMKLPNKKYSAYAGSKEGQEILSSPLFKNQTLHITAVKKKKDVILSDPELPRAIEKSKNHPVWKELATICFGCGVCSYVCPLCYCFETEDKEEMGEEKGARCRTWDSCMLDHFAETTAGNFRPELVQRIYNWYFHKFVRMPAEYGFTGCVDCDRCTIYCPAKINYRVVLTRVLADYKKKGRK